MNQTLIKSCRSLEIYDPYNYKLQSIIVNWGVVAGVEGFSRHMQTVWLFYVLFFTLNIILHIMVSVQVLNNSILVLSVFIQKNKPIWLISRV